MHSSFIILILAALVDYLVGDPWGWPHPVRVIGWVINQYTQLTFSLCKVFSFSGKVADNVGGWGNLSQLTQEAGLRVAGIVLALGLIAGSSWIGWLVIHVARRLHPLLGIVIETVLLAACFAGRSLRAAAEDVLEPLAAGDLVSARSRLSQYVGRDTTNLSESELLRAVLETVTENATDGVMAPLFYGLVGLAIPGIGSVPLALGYKAASTLDSTVGYREPPYTELGWFSARLEDLLTWLPCRLTVLTLACLSGKPNHVWQLCRRDAPKDPSPNAGWSECAYAAVLGVQMGGLNWYRGIAKQKPLLGDPLYKITTKQIHQALNLTRYIFLLWLLLAGLLAIAILNKPYH
jgi:adenosylcobinamide-phosphate synthase